MSMHRKRQSNILTLKFYILYNYTTSQKFQMDIFIFVEITALTVMSQTLGIILSFQFVGTIETPVKQ